MTAFLVSLALKFWPYIVGAIGLAAGALKWRSSILKNERARQAAKDAKARKVADEVDNDVGALPPDEARKELGKWSKH